jgi:hypothetical protein
MEDMNAEFRRQSRRLFAVLRAIVRRSTDSAGSTGDYAARLEIVTFQNRQATIHDYGALRAAAGFDPHYLDYSN